MKSYTMPTLVRWFSATLAILLGAGYAFGPDALGNQRVFFYASELFPIRAWGLLFVVCGILLVTTKISGHFICALTWTLWTVLLFIGSIDGGLTSWGAFIWPLYFAALNYMHVGLWGREHGRRVRERRG